MARSGGKILVDGLYAHGVDTLFAMPGDSCLSAFTALKDMEGLTAIAARSEFGAVSMAEAFGKLTGQPGIAMVDRGMGALKAAAAVNLAYQDATPLVLLVGLNPTAYKGRGTPHGIELEAVFKGNCKWVGEVDRLERLPELLSRAFYTAMSGAPGPVVLGLPQDVLEAESDVEDLPHYGLAEGFPGSGDMGLVWEWISASLRPVVLVGGGGWTEQAAGDITRFCETNNIPLVTAYRRSGLVDNGSPSFVGELGPNASPAAAETLAQADLIVSIGAHLDQMTTQDYSLVRAPNPKQKLVFVHADPEEHGRTFQADLNINAGPQPFCAQMVVWPQVDNSNWCELTWKRREDFVSWTESFDQCSKTDPSMATIMQDLVELLPSDALMTLDGGQFSRWIERYILCYQHGAKIATTTGISGYSLPAAVAAAYTFPDRRVICFVGDGGFTSTGVELLTAGQLDLAPIIVVFNNGMSRGLPSSGSSGTYRRSADFVALARGYGADAERVNQTHQFKKALEKALKSLRPFVIEVEMNAADLVPGGA